MNILGVIGGLGPESTVEYYRSIVTSFRQRKPDGSYPQVLINSIDLTKFLRLIEGNDLGGAADFLVAELERLASTGVTLGLIAANTPHIVFDDVQPRSPFPLISIVEATCRQAQSLALKKLGLFGAKFTMQGKFYQEVFSKAGISVISPTDDEQKLIHTKYMNELVNGIFLPETRDQLLEVASKMKLRTGIDGIILGGTELPLILRTPEMAGLIFLNTMQIHVEAAVTALLS